VSEIERCVVLAGGTGGAKLATGIQDLLGEELSVIANPANDVELLGVDVSPDPDLITYWLAGEIDEERGWGIKGDSFTVFERLVALGAPDWFRLSDRDLATCLYRRSFVAEGGRRTDAQAQIARALGVRSAVLPMCEQRVRTRVRTAEGWRGLQEFLIVDRAQPAIEGIELEGIAEAEPTPEILAAVSDAEAIVVGPSNPVISIGPILAITALREALADAEAPVIAVSPYVAGEVVKGPTDAFMSAIGRPSTATGVASLYEGLIEGMVCDESDPEPPPEGIEILSCPTLMEGPKGRQRVAEQTLDFARNLRSQ
jgi:LPPG:FO 2-phospho-L-lactate transferase